jgi:ATPase family associated with various cellular activities (AAA)
MSTNVSENRTVTPNEARSRLLRAFKVQRPVFLWGPPGVGKSEVVANIAKELGGHMIDLRLGQMEPTDLRGIPFFNKDLGKMDWAPPVDLPDEELASQYPIVILFMDEMNQGAPAVQGSAYQLILNRRVGKYKLPDNVVIVAAGNRESDKGVSYRMPAPLANRFVHLEVREDYDSWNEWAVKNRVHKDVVGYIGFAKQDLMDFNPRSSSRAYATPRSWSFVSEFLYDEDATDAELMDLIAGTVGDGLAVKFMAHRKVSSKMPNPTQVLNGTVRELEVKEISAMYSLTVSLCYELQDAYAKMGKARAAEWHEMADNFFRFMMDNFTTELVVMGKLKSFNEFHKRYGKYIIEAGGQS